MVSVNGGNAFSVIFGNHGFIHSDINEIAVQYQPHIGKNDAIAVCHDDPKIIAWFEDYE